jgi:hypothetical protein
MLGGIGHFHRSRFRGRRADDGLTRASSTRHNNISQMHYGPSVLYWRLGACLGRGLEVSLRIKTLQSCIFVVAAAVVVLSLVVVLVGGLRAGPARVRWAEKSVAMK